MKTVNWPAVALGLIIAYLILDRAGCLPSRESGSRDTISSVTTQVIDTSLHTITTNAPVFNIHVSTPKPEAINSINFADTNLIRSIIVDYLSEKIQRDSLEDDTIKATYTARIHKNSMERVDFSYRLKIPVSSETIITLKEPPTWHVSAGGYFGGTQAKDYGLIGIYQDKKNRSYIASYSLWDKSIRVGAALRIK